MSLQCLACERIKRATGGHTVLCPKCKAAAKAEDDPTSYSRNTISNDSGIQLVDYLSQEINIIGF